MKIILKNGTELNPIVVTGGSSRVHGALRDALHFIFPATLSVAELDAAFSAANCESITIVGDDGSEYIHKFYTIRDKLEKALVEVTPATPTTEAVTEERITVSMAQRTFVETQLAALTALLEGEV